MSSEADLNQVFSNLGIEVPAENEEFDFPTDVAERARRAIEKILESEGLDMFELTECTFEPKVKRTGTAFPAAKLCFKCKKFLWHCRWVSC